MGAKRSTASYTLNCAIASFSKASSLAFSLCPTLGYTKTKSLIADSLIFLSLHLLSIFSQSSIISSNKLARTELLIILSYLLKKTDKEHLSKQTDIEEYVQGVVLQTINTLVVDVVNDELDKRLVVATHQEALEVFDSVFNKS